MDAFASSIFCHHRSLRSCHRHDLAAASSCAAFVPATKALRVRPNPHRRSFLPVSVSLNPKFNMVSKDSTAVLRHVESKERIAKLFNKVELSVSPYDTAWVAMVPSSCSAHTPCFPECVNWLLYNQLCDGSWGLHYRHPLLLKDSLLSTLACVLALRLWSVGEEQVNKGLHFIRSSFSQAMNEKQLCPIGFDIIFPSMIEYARDLELNIPVEASEISSMLNKRDSELMRHRSEGNTAYLAYISEGIGKSQDWEVTMKYQRKNGSLFNSPSTTAAVLVHHYDAGLLNYLHSVLEKHGNSVPTIYPLDVYTRLCMVDNLEQMGIDRHFTKEIHAVLNETYRYWLQDDEEIFTEIATCAMAFRLLRTNGYNVSSDPLIQLCNKDNYLYPIGEHVIDKIIAVELYKASQIVINTDELALEKQTSWASNFLKQKLSSDPVHLDKLSEHCNQLVEDAFKFPFHAYLERLANRKNIEHYNADSITVLKTSFRSSNISNKDYLKFAVEDFNLCQSIHRDELKLLERWVVENNLDKLKFARQKLAYCYFSVAATLFSPELSDARLSWAKNGVLTTVVDDFFDVGGSTVELENLIHLVQRWNVNLDTDCCSDQVRIVFSALHSTICQIGLKASSCQLRPVTSHIIEIWLNLLNAMLREAEWSRNSSLPTIDEYMENAYVSFALGPIVLPALYFVGPKLSEELERHNELYNLYRLMSTCGRLLNDIQGYKRESKEGKLNAVTLRLIHGKGLVTEEDAILEMKKSVDSCRRELLKLVLQEEGGVVPKACKDLFWKMSKVVHLFYVKDDGFTSNEMLKAVKAAIHEPLSLDDL